MLIITIVRLLIAEFRVLIDSLKTLDQQIHAQQHAKSGAGSNGARTALKELLREHIERHQELIRTMHRLRSLLRFPSLLHIGFYLIAEAAFLVRLLIIKGEFALGLMIPLTATSLFIFEIFVFCMHIETLLDLNEQVGFVLYSFRWYDHMQLGKSYRQNISIVLFQAHNTIPFTAGGTFIINAELFANLVRITYSVVMGLGYMLSK
ncbi:odorant receptor coreceptor-like [Anopheles cruzii]|uniref:odorant receptor coreceptor-like n=1 Tax=Anopheles cruzii TaxID=68878 RepID=UPI0022EC47C4|nr:odorant receptor coreceptor-like [Anopheles cruzii]